MKNIIDIYKEYKIMPNLQLHQLRVAAVAGLVLDSLQIDINKEEIIEACLLHDMGNIIKFRLDYFPEFNNPLGLAYWQTVQDDYVKKYGENEHHATIQIAKELNVANNVVLLIDSVDPSVIEQNRLDCDFAKKICIYADNRVSPYKIVTIAERNQEVRERYKNHVHAFDEESRIHFNNNMEEIEKQIFTLSSILPWQINDENVFNYIETLKTFEIKILI